MKKFRRISIHLHHGARIADDHGAYTHFFAAGAEYLESKRRSLRSPTVGVRSCGNFTAFSCQPHLLRDDDKSPRFEAQANTGND